MDPSLEQQCEQSMPGFWQVATDPAWPRWIAGIDRPSGRAREELLAIMIATGNTAAAGALIRDFLLRQAQRAAQHAQSRDEP